VLCIVLLFEVPPMLYVYLVLQAPHMSPYPGEKSVLIMDNASIHHDQELVDLIEEGGARVVFLPPYSPDFSAIEEAFSAIKAWIRRNRDFVLAFENSVHALELACQVIDRDHAEAYFGHLVYMRE
jgi:hypothetical protein